MARFFAPQFVLASTFALVSCSGGGRSPAPLVQASPLTSSVSKAPASFRIVVPAAAKLSSNRSRAYVGSGTKSISIALTPTTSSSGQALTVTQNLSATSSGCGAISGGGYACIITLPNVAVGGYTIAFSTYDGALDGNGKPTGSVISANQTFPFTVVANTANIFSATLDGIPKSLTFTPAATSSLVATSSSTADAPAYAFAQCAGLESSGIEAANVDALDVDGNHIVGAGAPTVSLTSNASSVSVGTPTASTADLYPLSGPTSATALGAPGSSVTLTATATVPAPTASGGGITMAPVSTAITLTLAACGVVDRTTDASPGTVGSSTVPPGAGPGVGTTTSGEAIGDLRYVLQNAPAGALVVFALGSGANTVTTAAPLAPIEQNEIVDGASIVAIDGGNATAGAGHRVFFVDTGTVVFRNLTVQNALAHGGDGGAGGNNGGSGGGGCGCGGALFVNQSGAIVSLQGVAFVGMSATGGNGGTAPQSGLGGGGGGLGFAGGAGEASSNGGGGALSAGGAGTQRVSGAGGYGGGGAGAADTFTTAGMPGAGFGSNGAATGQNGAFGGGGGAAETSAGTGGFGGGGGGGGNGSGAGGFGGGGGGSDGGAGAAAGGAFGGNGGTNPTFYAGGGGGGAALGAAVFVNLGTLTTLSSSSTMPSVTAGAPGGDFSSSTVTATAGQSDATPVFNHAGIVNGAGPTATNGAGVPSALAAK